MNSVAQQSKEGRDHMRQAKAKYMAALTDYVTDKYGQHDALKRMTKIFSWIMALEVAHRIADQQLAQMCLFNIGEMRGQLPYEIHVRTQS